MFYKWGENVKEFSELRIVLVFLFLLRIECLFLIGMSSKLDEKIIGNGGDKKVPAL